MKAGYIAIVFFALLSCSGLYNGNITDMDKEEFDAKLTQSEHPQLIDVRTPEEFTEGAIPGSVNINLNSTGFLENIDKLDKAKPVFVYCRSGKRSKDAAYLLAEKGYTVYTLKGGYIHWKESSQRP